VITLYHAPRTRSMRVLWLLEELGLPYRIASVEFSAADIMMGYTLAVAKWFGILTDAYANVWPYVARLEARPAFQKALT
jgi:glutathione S-transferase